MHLTTLQIIGIVLLVLIFGGFLWRVAKRLFVIAFIAVAILLGIYFVSPQTLYNWFGEGNVHKVEHVVKQGADSAKTETKKLGDKVGNAVDSIK